MQKNKIHILSTKNLLPSIIEQAKQNNIIITEKELISIKPIQSKELYEDIMALVLDENILNIVFTSANSVNIIKNYLHRRDTYYVPNWNVFCLSGKTKDSLKPYIAEKKIIATAENASALAKKIIEHDISDVVFFCGNKRRDELPGLLRKASIKIKEIIVYETMPISQILNDGFNAILFFSPSAVKSFFSVNELTKQTVCFAIGKTTAKSIEGYTENKIITSEYPTQDMMLAAIKFYFENINCY